MTELRLPDRDVFLDLRAMQWHPLVWNSTRNEEYFSMMETGGAAGQMTDFPQRFPMSRL